MWLQIQTPANAFFAEEVKNPLTSGVLKLLKPEDGSFAFAPDGVGASASASESVVGLAHVDQPLHCIRAEVHVRVCRQDVGVVVQVDVVRLLVGGVGGGGTGADGARGAVAVPGAQVAGRRRVEVEGAAVEASGRVEAVGHAVAARAALGVQSAAAAAVAGRRTPVNPAYTKRTHHTLLVQRRGKPFQAKASECQHHA